MFISASEVASGTGSARGERGRGAAAAADELPWLRRRRRVSGRVVVACLAVIGAADLLIWLWRAPLGVQGLFDEAAHAATGMVALGAFGVAFEARLVLAVLAGSLLIDLDHIPDLLGSEVLQHGTPRPYTHSLLTVMVLAALALLIRGEARTLVVVGTLALLMHFVRDLAEPGGPGVALLWPLSRHAATLGYVWYGSAMAVLGATALAIRARPRAP